MSVQIVHFPHPGAEYPVRRLGTLISSGKWHVHWNNTEQHYRRLVVHPGRYVDAAERLCGDELSFWTEWEGETYAERIPNNFPHYIPFAKFEHRVLYPQRGNLARGVVANQACCANTDPCVFGSTFKYCFCRQRRCHDLKNLAVGSLILYGSRIEGNFYLDTVFVVASQPQSYNCSNSTGLNVSNAYRALALDPLTTLNDPNSYSFYRGATFEEQVNEMFSFTPAKIYRNQDYHKRCKLNLSRLKSSVGPLPFNLDNWRGAKVMTFAPAVARSVWRQVCKAVLRRNFLLGTHFDWPMQGGGTSGNSGTSSTKSQKSVFTKEGDKQ